MADNWDDDDWENAAPIIAPVAAASTSGEAAAAASAAPAQAAAGGEASASQFVDEDAEEEEEVTDFKKPSQPKKKVEKKYDKGEVTEAPLDDPLAEKMRQQRLVEEADYAAARDLFGGAGGRAGGGKLDAMLPRTVKDFEEYAALITSSYLTPHGTSKNYRALVKALVRAALEPLPAEDVKEVEAAVGAARAEKLKAERAAAAAKKAPKRNVNVGRGGGSAGLDDYIYDDPLDNDDFM